MATATVARTYHGTITGGSTDTITFSQNIRNLEIKNRSDYEIYFRVDGTAAVVGAAGTFVITARESLIIPTTSGTDAISLISASNAAYSLTAVND